MARESLSSGVSVDDASPPGAVLRTANRRRIEASSRGYKLFDSADPLRVLVNRAGRLEGASTAPHPAARASQGLAACFVGCLAGPFDVLRARPHVDSRAGPELRERRPHEQADGGGTNVEPGTGGGVSPGRTSWPDRPRAHVDEPGWGRGGAMPGPHLEALECR